MDQENPNGHKPPPESLHFDRNPIKCQRCQRIFEHFIFEEIDDLVQLRCGDVVIPRTQMVCLHCGWVFHWDIREKEVSRMTVAYSELVMKIERYKAE